MPTIQIYVTEEEKKHYKELTGPGMSFSEYVRLLIKADDEKPKFYCPPREVKQ